MGPVLPAGLSQNELELPDLVSTVPFTALIVPLHPEGMAKTRQGMDGSGKGTQRHPPDPVLEIRECLK
jgi:hypothetical protein